jgi:hypothetical protein
MLKLKDNISKSNFLILILLIHLISCNNISFSQNVVLKLDWNDDTLVVNNRSILVPNQFHFDFFTAKIGKSEKCLYLYTIIIKNKYLKSRLWKTQRTKNVQDVR